MRVLLNVLLACVCAVATLSAQTHTLIVLSHSNHTVYELDPQSGRVLHEFVAPDQPHEGAVTADGATIFASVLNSSRKPWPERAESKADWSWRSSCSRPTKVRR